MKEVIIIGAGGHGRVVADIVRKSSDSVVGFLDDAVEDEGVIGKVADCIKHLDKYFVVAVGNNIARKNIAQKYPNLKWYTAIHPNAVISETVKMGEGTVVCANAVINADASIGNHCIINSAAVIEHDNKIGDFCHISPNATLCGTVSVGECTHIGAASVVKNNIKISSNIIVGIGAVVVTDLEDKDTYIGVPAKKMIRRSL